VSSSAARTYIGIEGGGTKTIAIVSTGNDFQRLELGPGNIRLMRNEQLTDLFRSIAEESPTPFAIGIGMAGVREEADRARIRAAAESIWPKVPSAITHDLAIALAAAETKAEAKVLVLSGTGSCCYGESRKRNGVSAKVGGWGHLLGDHGSGYQIALSALRELIYRYDRHGKWSALGEHILRSLILNEPNELIAWAQSASKSEIAALAPLVFENSAESSSRAILKTAAESLANDAVICANRVASQREQVAFFLAGSVLLKQRAFAGKVAKLIRSEIPQASFTTLEREAAWGAIELAREMGEARRDIPGPRRVTVPAAYYVPEFSPGESPTEQRNPASRRFHEFSTSRMVGVMLDAEGETVPAVRKESRSILRAVEAAAQTLQRKGRIFYVGAGTSGRLGILDASECPPTFRASPDMIQGIIAGGQRAIWQAVEGAEDDAEAGARALESRLLTAKDLVIGIAASGRTPFVWGALGYAKTKRARTVLICFNPSLRIEKAHRPEIVIAPNLGPEILTGSTRLKSGTATKIILNMISTIAMVRLGKVIGNLMVDLNPSNVKLRDRAIRILRELTGCSAESAETALEKNGWVIKDAWSALLGSKGRR
jgi:N-acetylmuramic acid 6-phosphate etherase